MWRTTFLATLCWGLLIAAAESRLSGTVVNRDGDPQDKCKVTFLWADAVQYEVQTNSQGVFYLEKPRPGTYRVKVEKDGDVKAFEVKIDARGLNPSTLVVDW